MQIEWAWPRNVPRITVEENPILLEGDAPCRVLLFHGLTGTPTEFAFLAHFLHRRGRLSVECPALANHGQPLAILARTRWEEILEGARIRLRSARVRATRDRATLIVGGLSLGAILSLILAAESPNEVDGIIALSPTLFYDGWSVPWSQRLIGLADYSPFKYLIYLRERPPYGLKDETLRRRVAAAFECTKLGHDERATELGYTHFPLRLFCEMRHLIALCKRTLTKVRAPLLVVHAIEDDVTSPRNADYILMHTGSEKRRLLLLNNSYHLITADLDRMQVASAMAAFCLDLRKAERHASEAV
jgi:carboxylesterase